MYWTGFLFIGACSFLCLCFPGPEPDITAVIQVPPSDPVSSGDSVTLQCSVLSDSDGHTCPTYDKLYWFRADESHPSLVHVHGSTGDECDGSLEAHSPHRCVFNFCKSLSSSDLGTYYCAVVTCGEILFGQGIKLENEGNSFLLFKYHICVFNLESIE